MCQALGIELEELEDWSCCGATSAHSLDHDLSLALPARNLALASRKGLDLVAPCAACFNRLKAAEQVLWGEDPWLRELVGRSGVETGEPIVVRCLVDALVNVVGLERIQEKVTRPLTGLRVVPYYGCLLVRPPEVTQFDDPEDPQSLDRLTLALSADCPEWYYKTECCGAGLSLTKTEVVVKLVGDILQGAKEAGANCVIAACPFCQFNLDSRQDAAAALLDTKFDLPILYFTQLMGLAFGIEPGKLGLNKHLVSVEPCLKALEGASAKGG